MRTSATASVPGPAGLTHMTDALRWTIAAGGSGTYNLLLDFGVIAVCAMMPVLIAGRLYARLAR